MHSVFSEMEKWTTTGLVSSRMASPTNNYGCGNCHYTVVLDLEQFLFLFKFLRECTRARNEGGSSRNIAFN